MPSFSIAVGERADAQARRVLGAEVFVDDDDGEAEFHGCCPVPGSCRRLRVIVPVEARASPESEVERRELCGDSGGMAIAPVTAPRAPASGRDAGQIFGSVTPCCPWYLPPRSL